MLLRAPCPCAVSSFPTHRNAAGASWTGCGSASGAAQPAGRAGALRLLGRVGCEGLNWFFRFTDQAGRSPLPPAFSRRRFNPSVLFWALVTNVRLKYVFPKWVGLIQRPSEGLSPLVWCLNTVIAPPHLLFEKLNGWKLLQSSAVRDFLQPVNHSRLLFLHLGRSFNIL